MTDTLTTLPHWDMTSVFPGLDSPEFGAAWTSMTGQLDDLERLFTEHDIAARDRNSVDQAVVAMYDDLQTRLNELATLNREIGSYVHSFITTESRNDVAQGRYSELQQQGVRVAKLLKRFVAWVGSLDVEALIERSSVARDHAFRVRKAREEAAHQMSPDQEDLAASLHPAGQGAWSRLHGNLTSRLTVDVPKPDGSVETVPIAAVAGFMRDPDPALREAAYRASLEVWEQVEVPLAAALNSVKGWQNELNRRRGFDHSLDEALFSSNVDRQTLDAMQEACVASFPDFRRYLRAKAKALGKERMGWFDRGAPLGAEGKRWEWDETVGFVVDRFGSYSPELAALAQRAFDERWIDAEPRAGKRGGGFCMSVHRDVSRILVNYTPDFGSVATVSHELGHAYHNLCAADRTFFQSRTPMPLAETASTFCETIVTNAMLAQADETEKLAIVENDLQRDCAIVLDIHGRFLFEREVFERRAKRELTPAQICELQLEAQREVFGDGLDHENLHPYYWCVAPHYYGGVHYYNWPYTFGLLFGLGLYAAYERDPGSFRAGYDDLLASTGMADAATLADRFGLDIRSTAFWDSSLEICRAKVDLFEDLV